MKLGFSKPTRTVLARIVLTLSTLLATAPGYSEQAAVRSYENPALGIGQSFLASYGERCFVFMPSHVAKEADARPSLVKMAKKPVLGSSQDIWDLGDDVSMGMVQGEIARDCGRSISLLSRAVDKHVENTGLATLRWVNFDGSQGNIAVSVLDHGDPLYLRIQPANSKQQIRKGMSGSVLWANGHPVGILLSVHAARGRATVFRMDAMLARAEKKLRASTTSSIQQKEPALLEADNMLASDLGASVTSWSVMAESADKQTTNLLDANLQSSWRAAVEKWPVSLEIDLAGEKQALGRIQLSGVGVDDEAHLPKRVTLLFNLSSSRKSWRTFSTVDLQFDENHLAEIRFPATWVRDLKLEFMGAQDQKTIELTSVSAYRQ